MNEQQQPKPTDIHELMDSFDGGALGERIARALSETARGVVLTGEKKAKGKVTVEFDIVQIGDSQQVQIGHKVTFKRPTPRGTTSETHQTSTPLYVTTRGVLTLLPNSNLDMFPAGSKSQPSTTQQ